MFYCRLFTDADIEFINSTTIREVIMRVNPIMDDDDIQNNPFRWLPSGKLQLRNKNW